VLASVAGVGVILAVVLEASVFDRLWMLAGMTLGGFFLLIPISVTGADSARDLRAGGWLGFASLVLFLVAGALLPLSSSSQPRGAMDQPASSTATPAGWYPDPTGQTRLRYWDGAVWTETTAV
jgi:hypothetical protein